MSKTRTKRQVLEVLSANDLRYLVDLNDIEVADRRVRADLVDALVRSRRVDLSEDLEGLSRNALKAACRALGLDDGGRAKAVIVARLLGTDSIPETESRGSELTVCLPPAARLA